MRGYKGFNRDMTCTMGNGTFQYRVGKTYEEKRAKTVQSGFHFVEEPLEVLSWYPNGRFCLVEAAGDIDEDQDKLACTKITIVKELSLEELYAHEVHFMLENPKREISRTAKTGSTAEAGKPILVIDENPTARGKRGSSLFLIQKKRGKILKAAGYKIDGKRFKANRTYNIEGVDVSDEE